MGSVQTFIRTTSSLRPGPSQDWGEKRRSSHHRSGVAPHGANVILGKNSGRKSSRRRSNEGKAEVDGEKSGWTRGSVDDLTSSTHTELAENAALLGAADNHDLIRRPKEFEHTNPHQEIRNFRRRVCEVELDSRTGLWVGGLDMS